MIIEIDDDETPEKRRELLKTLPIKYGMEKFNSMLKTSEFLGFSYRYVRNTVNEHDYLKELKHKTESGNDYYDSNLWGNYDRE